MEQERGLTLAEVVLTLVILTGNWAADGSQVVLAPRPVSYAGMAVAPSRSDSSLWQGLKNWIWPRVSRTELVTLRN